MNRSYTNKNFSNPKVATFDWLTVQTEMKNKLGADIYESWLKKISFEEEINATHARFFKHKPLLRIASKH